MPLPLGDHGGRDTSSQMSLLFRSALTAKMPAGTHGVPSAELRISGELRWDLGTARRGGGDVSAGQELTHLPGGLCPTVPRRSLDRTLLNSDALPYSTSDRMLSTRCVLGPREDRRGPHTGSAGVPPASSQVEPRTEEEEDGRRRDDSFGLGSGADQGPWSSVASASTVIRKRWPTPRRRSSRATG